MLVRMFAIVTCFTPSVSCLPFSVVCSQGHGYAGRCVPPEETGTISAEQYALASNAYSAHLWAAKVCGVPVCHVHRFSFGRAMSRNIVIGLAIKTLCCAICEEY
jgi:hypothetical protein